MELCSKNNVEYVEVPVAYDGIAVVVHPENTWATSLTTAELKKIWEPEAQGKILKWSEVREGWPDHPLRLYGAGVDSGTFDYFTEAIVKKEHSSRGDYTSSEDDNVVIQGVSQDPYALGYFGFAYYIENTSKVKAVPVDDGVAENGAGPIAPSVESVGNGTYQPLARPVFVYFARKALDRPEVETFAMFYLSSAAELTKEVGYISLPAKAYKMAQERIDARRIGSVFEGKGSKVGVSIEALMATEKGNAVN